jgi:hypothetical protein
MAYTDTYYIEDHVVTVDGKNYSVIGEIDIEWDTERDLMLYENCEREVYNIVISDSDIYDITLIDDDGNEYTERDHGDLVDTATHMLYNAYNSTVLKEIVFKEFFDEYENRKDSGDE